MEKDKIPIKEEKEIYFKPGTINLTDKMDLSQVKDWLLTIKMPVTIEGYYCESDLSKCSSDEYLLEIAEKRASVVKEKLIGLGINSINLTTIAFGKSNDKCMVKIVVYQSQN